MTVGRWVFTVTTMNMRCISNGNIYQWHWSNVSLNTAKRLLTISPNSQTEKIIIKLQNNSGARDSSSIGFTFLLDCETEGRKISIFMKSLETLFQIPHLMSTNKINSHSTNSNCKVQRTFEIIITVHRNKLMMLNSQMSLKSATHL